MQSVQKYCFHCQICKFVGFLLPSSSWLLKLPIVYASVTSAAVCLPEPKLFEVIALDSYKCLVTTETVEVQ